MVDRAFGGRFAPKDGWRYLTQDGGGFKVNNMVTDLFPDNSDHKPFKPGTAAAVNPVCLNCKTRTISSTGPTWATRPPTAKWSRTSKVVEMARRRQPRAQLLFSATTRTRPSRASCATG